MSSSLEWLTRAGTRADTSAVRAVTESAFERTDEAGLVDALSTDAAWIDGLSLVSTTPSRLVVGHALLTRCHVDDVAALCLAPCSVLPDYQRKGAGSAAIRAELTAAKGQGGSFVIVLGHAACYPRFGFRRASEAGIRLQIEVPDEALMAMSLDSRRPLPRGTVSYAPPFGI